MPSKWHSHESPHRLIIIDRHIFGAAAVFQLAMFRADAGIIQPGRNRMRLDDLPIRILHQVDACRAARPPWLGGQRRGMPAAGDPVPPASTPISLHAWHFDIGIEQPDRVRTAAHAGNHRIRLTTDHFRHLHLAFVADDH